MLEKSYLTYLFYFSFSFVTFWNYAMLLRETLCILHLKHIYNNYFATNDCLTFNTYFGNKMLDWLMPHACIYV